jgi:hypothetical protein
MSWRSLLFYAAVIVVIYGAATVVFASGSPDRPGRSRQVHSSSNQEQVDTQTPYPISSADLARCSDPTNARSGWSFCQTDRQVEGP